MSSFQSWVRALTLLGALALPPLAQALAVNLQIREARPPQPGQGECTLQPGRDRSNGPVTFGLPLAAQPAVCDTDALSIDGASSAQFRVLHRRPDGQCGGAGSIEWLLLDTQVTLAANATANNLTLRDVAPPAPLPPLASDNGTTIAIDSGAATFSVRKSGFNLLDGVSSGGNLLRANGPGIELVAAGVNYDSARDPASDVVVEENGPLRAVIRARGRLLSATGTPYLAYTARLTFSRLSAQVRVVFTLRNASVARQENLSFQSLELVLPSTLSAATYSLATHLGPVGGTLAAGQTATLIQGENTYPSFRDYDFDDFDGAGNVIKTKWPTLREGYEVSLQGSPLAIGTRTQPIDLFYGSLQQGANRITVGTRFAAGWWPQALRLAGNGDLRVGLFPVGNDRVFWARHAGHVTREVLLDFSANGSAADAMYRFQYPLTGRASAVDTYNDSDALWETLVSPAEELQHYLADGLGSDYPNFFAPVFHIVRHFYWATGGGRNQYDQAKVAATNFLRWDSPCAGVAWLHADQKFLYNADLSVYHSDDYDGGRGDVEYFNAMANIEFIPSARAVFEGEHPHAYGLALWYWLTGDERIREAYLDWGEFLFHPRSLFYDIETRGIIWRLYNLVDLYRFSGLDVYRDAARALFNNELYGRTAVAGVAHGTDFQRGFYAARADTFDVYGGGAPFANRSIASFITGAMHARAYAYFGDFGAATELERDRARDLAEGVSRFIATEHWYEYSSTPGDYGYPYRQGADSLPADPRPEGNWISGFKEVWPALYQGYTLTSDPEFLRQARLLQRTQQTGVSGEFYDWPDRQTLESLLWHPDRHPHWVDLPLTVTPSGNGFNLSWTVPPGARAYWFKTADRTIVPWLGFNRQTRAFAFSPAGNVAFFAADNLDGEPLPLSAGSPQTFTVTLAPVPNRRFAARVLIDAALPADPIFANAFEAMTP